MKIILIGRGGHSGVVCDAISRAGIFQVLCSIEETPNCKIVGNKNQMAFIAIGDNSARERLSKTEYNFSINVVHPSADVRAIQSDFPSGCYFGANSVIGNNSRVGNFSIINTGVILEHDSLVGDFTHLCPGVVTGGRVKIGSRTTIGLGTMIRDGVTIGNNCIIGMGSVVLTSIPDNYIAYGNPCRLQHENRRV